MVGQEFLDNKGNNPETAFPWPQISSNVKFSVAQK